ncbi:hypothetical protein CAI21_22095 [Alkalilimnicola ehrlichii]|uniref:Uncharacterized protein n=1 Tax=Alkalilimnicola ehrlichii TaxID=351052 RepID=A0A3E0WQ73_9GAMM|nr:hypothetical protein [Alkalilimnicola ehrlichii]RFA24319.1 hypothetical protein CAI21_22095 [Alkalilimnicola ehrlichii]RFA35120.1 hypothetical protein CAL65_13515 [Alkalilimnicola ehrlichii]
MIGDYMQILGGDCYSDYPSAIGEMIRDYHDQDAAICMFMAHSPMFSAFDMRFVPQDNLLQERLRNECFRFLQTRDNVKFCHGGNIHVRSITKPLVFVEDDPGTDDKIEVGGSEPGWIVEGSERHGLIEYGQGWVGGRAGTIGNWFLPRKPDTAIITTL